VPGSPPDENTAHSSETVASGATAGVIIGPYHLLELIGTGGMGEVWLAEQKYPLPRRVALKLIKTGMDTHEVVARFESERQALALMNHPAIAKVFDAGSTAQGRPYFVMEYVAGNPITIYCDKHRLTTHERLELFMHVCEGVQHAHQKAIIHRDLKPSNILVTDVDGRPVPKIIDFGVAKAISQRLTVETMFTRAGSLIGTPDYMSPEQADLGGEDIDTRTDVYSLGAVLYELLVGALPLDLRKLSFEEILRRLREQDTVRPSTKVRTLGEESITNAQNRRTEPASLTRQLRGDLDAITLKALEKERARRYGTPSELAADIGRHLRNEPVLARPASVAYRMRKYIRRHSVGVAVASGLVLLLAFFATVQAFQLRRITRERDRADRVTNFITSMFKMSNPSEARGNRVTAREILDKASKEISTGLASDPVLQGHLMDVMGTVYLNLGLYSQAGPLFARALDIRRRVLGPEHPDTLKSMSNFGTTLEEEGRFAEAEHLHRQLLEIRRRKLGPDHEDTLVSMNSLANSLGEQGRYADAEKLIRQAVDIERRVFGPEHKKTIDSLENLAITLDQEKHYSEAEKLEQEVFNFRRRTQGLESPDTLRTMSNLGSTLAHIGNWGESEKLEREVLEIQRRVLGTEHPDTASTVYNLACIAAHGGHRDEAVSLLRQALDHHLDPETMLGMESDPELSSLRGDPRFQALVSYAHKHADAVMAK
jgi:non-specific serine/threonine protein kinase/serine/threonine-protein kinase